MSRQTAWDITVIGREDQYFSVEKTSYTKGMTVSPADWLSLGARKRQLFLSRGIVELLPRCVGRPKQNGE